MEHDYVGAFFYVDNELQHFSHEEGRVLKTENTFRYEYNITDHLGNVRVSFSDIIEDGVINEATEVLQEDHYYPFGLRLGGLSTSSGVPNRYRYNGKELQDELGLNWYDYGARMYDPSIGRWNGVDALAEKYGSSSPYNYVMNSPMNMVDPDGRSAVGQIKGDQFIITANIYFYGEGASKDFVRKAIDNINKVWNGANGTIDIDGKTYDVKFKVKGKLVSKEKAVKIASKKSLMNNFAFVGNSEFTKFDIEDRDANTFTTEGLSSGYLRGGNHMQFRASEADAAAHEFGHSLGWYDPNQDNIEKPDELGYWSRVSGLDGYHDHNSYLDENGQFAPGVMAPAGANGTPISNPLGVKYLNQYPFHQSYAGSHGNIKSSAQKARASDVNKLAIFPGLDKTANAGKRMRNFYRIGSHTFRK